MHNNKDDNEAGRRLRRAWFRWTALALLCSLAALIAGTVLFARQAGQIDRESARQIDLNVRLRQLQTVLVTLGDAETGQRGYLLTHKPAYLAPYRAAVERMPQLLGGLDGIPIAAPALPAHVEAVHRLIGLKFAEMAQTIRLHDEGRRAAALQIVQSDAGLGYMVQAKAEVNAVLDLIRAERDGMTRQLAASTAASRHIAVWTVSALVLCILLAGLQIGTLSAARTRYETALTDSERFVRGLTDQLPERIAYIDHDGRYRFANLAHVRSLGLAREAVLGRTRGELTGPADAATTQCVARALQGELQRFEFDELVDGQRRRFDCQLIPDVADDGTVRGVFTTSIDITPLKATERSLRELTAVLDNTPDFVVQTDGHGRISYMNPAMRRALGIAAEAPMHDHRYSEYITPQSSARFDSEILPQVQHDGAWVGEAAVLLKDGRSVPVNQMIIAHRDAAGRVARYSAVMRDISVEVAARQQLQLQTATLRSVIEAIPAMVAVFDGAFRYRLVNKAFERWRGRERHEVVGRGVAELFGAAEFERSWPWAQRALAGETVSFEKDYPESVDHRHVNISYIPLRLDSGEIGGVIAVAQDITRQREETIRLLQLSERDALTGLLNRSGLSSELERSGGEPGGRVALLYIDLDHFKPVNDNHGHLVGDEVLQQFAQRLQALVRPTDAVARLGGDEFAIVLRDLREPSNALAVADKVVDAARTPFVVGALTLRVGASVGVAFKGDDENGWTGLLERADAQVYQAKAAGRGRRA